MSKQPCISFHGAIAIGRLRRAVDLACDEIHNQIATCPDATEYAEDIEELEHERSVFVKLRAKLDRKLAAPEVQTQGAPV
mgnify:CR=1 FL=1